MANLQILQCPNHLDGKLQLILAQDPRPAACSYHRMSRDYTKLRVFDAADSLVVDVYKLTRALPRSEEFGLKAQIRRAAVSVPTNIVEGSARRSDKDYLRFLETALGSACEARYLLDLSVRLEMLDGATVAPFVERYTLTIKSLSALITHIADSLAEKAARKRRSRQPRPGRTESR